MEHIFLPVIRRRGEKYARSGRVNIKELEPGFIRSTVRGTINYAVTIFMEGDGSGRVRIGCTCPFFRQGIPCKHIWATVCKADERLRQIPCGENIGKGPGIDVNRLFQEDLWVRRTGRPPWKPVQDFVIKYRLEIDKGSVSVGVFEQYVRKDGRPGRTRRITERAISRPGLPRQDRLLLPFLSDLAEKAAFYSGPGFFTKKLPDMEDILLRPSDAGVVLPMLAETGRCMAVIPERRETIDPLVMPPSPEARLEIRVSPRERNALGLEPEIILSSDSEQQKAGVEQVVFLNSDPVFFIFQGLLYQLDGPSYPWLEQARATGLPPVRKEELPAMVRDALSISRVEVLKLPDDLCPERITGVKPRLHLTLELTPEAITARATVKYLDKRIVPVSGDRTIHDYDSWQVIERDVPEEERLLKLLTDCGLRQEGTRDRYRLDIKGAEDILALLEDKGVILEASDRKIFRTGRLKTFSITSGIDWFDLEAEVSFGDETVPLPDIVRAYLKGEKIIRLSSGARGILPEAWLKKHSHALELAGAGRKGDKKGRLRFSFSHTLLIDQMLQEASRVRVDREFARRRDKIREFKGIHAVKTPPGFEGRLRKYQKEALGWFLFLEDLRLGGILADDMGLGKTVQVLAWLLEKRRTGPDRPCLVVAPTSLVFNWKAEAERFTPGLMIASYLGAGRHQGLEDCLKADIVLTTYGILRRDIQRLSGIKFHYVVLDESQCIKNPDSAISKAVRLIQADHRLCLTGTPLENHIGELWSQMEFLNPGMLGPRERFMKRFARPMSQGEKTPLSSLGQLVKPFILRRTKEEVAAELPEKQEMVIRCHMTSEQRELYLRVRDHYRMTIMKTVSEKGIRGSKIKVLEGLLRLRQAANHPALIGAADVNSGKFLQLMDLLEETVQGGHKALVFSQFTKMLAIIREELSLRGIRYVYLDGRTPQARREERVNSFQEDQDIKLFLISLRAGGMGLNLTAADYVFIVDPWWNPAVELQAVDRTHRIGQTRKVVTYRLISRDTVEEKVLKLQKKKQEIVGSILSGSRNMLSSLSADDLEILFS